MGVIDKLRDWCRRRASKRPPLTDAEKGAAAVGGIVSTTPPG